ncbi:3-deoxy-D-arabino-heptulosonate 7-phosphate synthase [Bordetella bronchialis]|uniref:3-deoxy-D-arabino-heptulosonate 7-phosphate synthase n=1 Tax=Bordetella bronchialis TaxID=463025 RepID=A0A193FX78_9BORD|nr:3-deoxy-D-arabino-heptulosonate 7-phosphate synthase [Bordetella bronchialis]ANN71786.1 3-deoxy-D-arabino-heptulosonate 7-phosphate synthase [Bordetella bronchialis]
MPPLPSSPLLDATLRAVARRYRLPAMGAVPAEADPGTVLAVTIEEARAALARNAAPDASLRCAFLQALAELIHQAMREEGGDPVFQAMVLRHGAAPVREYASLSAHAEADRRQVRAAVNAIAHPARLQRLDPGPRREALAGLHAAAASASWTELDSAARRLHEILARARETPAEDTRVPPGLAVSSAAGLADPPAHRSADPSTHPSTHPSAQRISGQGQTLLMHSLRRLRDDPALARLVRLESLSADTRVRRYRSLWDRNGPRSGTRAAVARGATSQERGAAVEEAAARALQALARRLDREEGGRASYRVVTSMRVPASIPASHDRAKSEWDVVLLRRENDPGEASAHPPVDQPWDVCLLVEAKASVDAATTDLPRLVRGLRLLAHADARTVYPFQTRQGTVRLRGAPLRALTTDDAGLARSVLYCCDAPAETRVRWLGAASRMQLLSAQPCLAYASTLRGEPAPDPSILDPVWHQLLESAEWQPVLHQYSMLRQVRELMVHVDDLRKAIDGET